MQIIFRVAKTELRTLFYSPIAWFLMIVFMIQCSVVYFGMLSRFAVQQEVGGLGLKYMSNVTTWIFLSFDGLFGDVMQNLYLYVPLLTMSLVSRETGSGTIKLLYSSPIDVSEIVLGKYLAMMVYSLLLLAIVALFVVSGSFHIQHAEKGMLLSGLLGFYLLLCAYSAIGLFMSCLTNYQVVAAICTFVMIGILSYIGNLWQDVELVRGVTHYLSMNGRALKMLSGLLTSKDVIYFLVIICMFLGFSICKLKASMESKPRFVQASRYLAIFASTVLIGYLSSRPGLVRYYDVTTNKSRTLSPTVQKIISELKDAPLEVTVYNNLLGRFWFLGTPKSYTSNMERWEDYIRFKPDIQLNTVFYYDSVLDMPDMMKGYDDKSLKEIAEQNAKSNDFKMSLFKTPGEMRKIIDLRPEMNRFVMQLKWKDRTTFLRVFDDQRMWPGETEVAAALKRLLQAKLPKIYFLTGNLERDIFKLGDKEYQAVTNLRSFRYSLINQGFDVDTLSLEARDLPSDISVLVIADPKVELGAAVKQKLQAYINSGGNLLIAGEPGRQSVVNPILAGLGVEMTTGTILQQSRQYEPTFVVPRVTREAGRFTRALQKTLEDSAKVSMPGVAGLKYSGNGGFKIEPLLITDPVLSWNKAKPLDPDLTSAVAGAAQSEQLTAMPIAAMNILSAGGSSTAQQAVNKPKSGTVHYSPLDGDTKGPITTAISLSRKVGSREQRIIVTGDADFMSNIELRRFNMETNNFDFNTALFSWLTYGEFPIDATRPDARDNRLNVSTDAVSRLKIIYTWIGPALLTVLAAVILIRRKRK